MQESKVVPKVQQQPQVPLQPSPTQESDTACKLAIAIHKLRHKTRSFWTLIYSIPTICHTFKHKDYTPPVSVHSLNSGGASL